MANDFMDQLAGFVTGGTYTGPDRDRAWAMISDTIRDTIGVGVAGAVEDVSLACLSTVTSSTGVPLLCQETQAPPADAAFFHGTAFHAIDYDDITHPAFAHPSCHLVAALLSLASTAPVGGDRIIEAYLIGLEIEGRFGTALNPGLRGQGWHSTAVLGPLAAAAAGARLIGLPAPQAAHAMATAVSMASGLRVNFGTMVKPVHAGHAARSGVVAVLLAAAGVTGAEDAIDGAYGYLDVFGDREHARSVVLAGLGRDWVIDTEFGLAIKPYPSCGATHPSLEAAIDLASEVSPDEVQEITVGVSELGLSSKLYSRPTNVLEAKFSIEYCVAIGLIDGAATRGSFSTLRTLDPQVRQLIERTCIVPDERVKDSTEWGSTLRVQLADGRTLERVVEFAKGKPAKWMGGEDLEAKFLDCSVDLQGQDRAKQLFEQWSDLSGVDNVGALMATDTWTRSAS